MKAQAAFVASVFRVAAGTYELTPPNRTQPAVGNKISRHNTLLMVWSGKSVTIGIFHATRTVVGRKPPLPIVDKLSRKDDCLRFAP